MPDSSLSLPPLQSWIPGVRLFRTYDARDLNSDLIAGVSVAAVAIPIGIAYAQLAGAPPVVGIYSCLLTPFAYALFGSSRQLIVNPDAAACAVVAATTAPLAAGDPTRFADLSLMLTFLTGLICIAAGIARLGVIANFLSRPILVGYLNGIAISIIVGQLGRLMGIDVPSAGVFRTLAYVFRQLPTAQPTTTLVGVSLLIGLVLIKRFAQGVPGPLVAAVVGICLVYFLGLYHTGVKVAGTIPAGLPLPRIPKVALADLASLTGGAATIMVVSFCSMMTTARGFATKNNYQIDANRDLIALGVCDIASGLSRGFVVSGADSRTAVADSAGGKTQLTSVVASATIAIVLLFFTSPLAYLPTTALAAILISSSIGLLDLAALRRYYHIDKAEFRHLMVAMLGVMTVGVLKGVVLALGLSILRLIVLGSKPHDAVLGLAEGKDYWVDLATEPHARPIDGVVIHRFDSSLVFFNVDYFANRVRQCVREAKQKPSWFILDAEAIPMIDSTAADVLASLHMELEKDGIQLGIARPKSRFLAMIQRTGVAERIGKDRFFGSIRAAVDVATKSINARG